MRGPDPIVLRVPRGGGIARTMPYPAMDSVLWSSTGRAPALDHTLGFDAELGTVAYVDARGLPGRIDFRGGGAGTVTRAKHASLSSADGSSIFGVDDKGRVVRFTPTGEWRYAPPRAPRAVFPQPDGALVVVADAGDSTVLWKMFPPETTLVASVSLPRGERAVRTQVGDRIYLTLDSGLVGVRTRDMAPVPPVRLGRAARVVTPTPSGDRLYMLGDTASRLLVFDRYGERLLAPIALPGRAADLRMGPLGRYLLVRADGADSVWVVNIGTGQLMGALASEWRTDLPTVAPDGAIVLASGKDVTFVDPQTLRVMRGVKGGASDFWYFLAWDGFRPRATGLDEPVSFADRVPVDTTADSTLAMADSLVEPATDGWPATPGAASPFELEPRPAPEPLPRPVTPVTTAPSTAPATAPSQPPRDSVTRPPARRAGFHVQFAALLNESSARELAPRIHGGGQTARVVPSTRDGTTIYRVVLGPFGTRADAERAAREAGRSYWIYEGAP